MKPSKTFLLENHDQVKSRNESSFINSFLFTPTHVAHFEFSYTFEFGNELVVDSILNLNHRTAEFILSVFSNNWKYKKKLKTKVFKNEVLTFYFRTSPITK